MKCSEVVPLWAVGRAREVEVLVSGVFSLASYVQISHLTSVFFIKWDYLCQMYVIKVL